MKKTLALILIICCFSSLVNAQQSSQMIWENNLQNGYISTKPLIADDQIIVRTSGFWTSSDRPHVYSFDPHTLPSRIGNLGYASIPWRMVRQNE